MKRIRLMAFLMAAACLLAGCGSEAKQYDKNTLVVKKNGSFVEVAVEDFKDSSVKAEELEAYIDEQIEDYNGEDGSFVKRTYINTEDMGRVKLVLRYKDIDSYNGFNMLECRLEDYGNISEEDVQGDFTSADGKTVKSKDFANVENAEVFIFSEAMDVVVKGDILYYNKQVKVTDGIATTSGEDKAVIIFR